MSIEKLKSDFEKAFPESVPFHGEHDCAALSEGQECCVQKDWFWKYIDENFVSKKELSENFHKIVIGYGARKEVMQVVRGGFIKKHNLQTK